jgi:hypothetical protein
MISVLSSCVVDHGLDPLSGIIDMNYFLKIPKGLSESVNSSKVTYV